MGVWKIRRNIEENKDLMDFLGIYKVVSEKTELTGVKLFEGLLLGGEVVYETPEDEDEKEASGSAAGSTMVSGRKRNQDIYGRTFWIRRNRRKR